MDFSLLLRMQQQSITMTFLLLSKVIIFTRAVVHPEKLTLDVTLTLQMVFQGNDELDGGDNV
jgi:hypothetical protein